MDLKSTTFSNSIFLFQDATSAVNQASFRKIHKKQFRQSKQSSHSKQSINHRSIPNANFLKTKLSSYSKASKSRPFLKVQKLSQILLFASSTLATMPDSSPHNFTEINIKILSWKNTYKIDQNGHCCNNSKSLRNHCRITCKTQFRACIVPNLPNSLISDAENVIDALPQQNLVPILSIESSRTPSKPQELLDYGLNFAQMPINHCSLLTNKDLIRSSKRFLDANKLLRHNSLTLSIPIEKFKTFTEGYQVIVEALNVGDSTGKLYI